MANKTTQKKKGKLVDRIQVVTALIGAAAALIGVIIFITGKENILEFFSRENTPVVLFQDDFSDTTQGWITSEYKWAIREYRNGEYIIKVGEAVNQGEPTGFSAKWKDCISGWSVIEMRRDDLMIEVTARVSGESQEGFYGILFNYQDDNNFFYVEVTPRGRWDFVSRIDGDFHDIITFQNNPTPAIGLGRASNRLQVMLTKSQVDYYVNGEQLTKTQLPRPVGSVGLFVATCSAPVFEVAFDDFKVSSYSP